VNLFKSITTSKDSSNYFIKFIWVIQLLSAFSICINHLHFSLLKGVRLSPFWENQPTLLGITFLTFSTGFLTHVNNLRKNKADSLSEFIAQRFIRIWWPVFFAVILDVLFFMPAMGEEMTSFWPLLSGLTLTQTWSYNVFDGKSLPLPFGFSNLIWVGSCLFGLFLVHGISIKLWRDLSIRASLTVLVISVAYCVSYFGIVDSFGTEIKAWAEENYGPLAGPYQFINWLYLYTPFAELGNYFCGVAFAQFLYRKKSISLKETVIFGIFSCLLILIPVY